MMKKAFFAVAIKPWEKEPNGKAFFAVAKKPPCKTEGFARSRKSEAFAGWEKVQSQSDCRAQISLEYLLTYSWALVLVATIVGVVVLLFGGPIETPVFNSSQPTEFPLVGGGNIDAANNVSVALKNASGGTITVTGFSLNPSFSDPAGGQCSTQSKLNDKVCSTFTTSSLDVGPGDEMRFSNIKYTPGGVGTITVTYKDETAFSRTLTITGKKGAR